LPELLFFGDDMKEGEGIYDMFLEGAETTPVITIKGDEIDPNLLPNPTFQELDRKYRDRSGSLPQELRVFREKCKCLMRLGPPPEQPESNSKFKKLGRSGTKNNTFHAGTLADLPKEENEEDKDGLPKLTFDEFKGIALRLPRYYAPVLDYLQPSMGLGYLHAAGTAWSSLVLDEEPDPEGNKSEKVVLMPDVTFTLVDRKTGVDYGSTSLALQEYHESAMGHTKNWFSHVCDERKALEEKEDMRKFLFYDVKDTPTREEPPAPVSIIRDTAVHGHSYKLEIDVLAPHAGGVKFSQAMRLGATLTQQWICTMTKVNDLFKGKNDLYNQLFAKAGGEDEDDFLDTATDIWARMGLAMPFEEDVGQILLNAGDWQLHPSILQEDKEYECQPRLAVRATGGSVTIWKRTAEGEEKEEKAVRREPTVVGHPGVAASLTREKSRTTYNGEDRKANIPINHFWEEPATKGMSMASMTSGAASVNTGPKWYCENPMDKMDKVDKMDKNPEKTPAPKRASRKPPKFEDLMGKPLMKIFREALKDDLMTELEIDNSKMDAAAAAAAASAAAAAAASSSSGQKKTMTSQYHIKDTVLTKLRHRYRLEKPLLKDE
jgi:hypothetical protein